MTEEMIRRTPVVTPLDSDKRIKGIFIKIISNELLFDILLAYLRILFEWTIEKQYFDLTMSICTRLEV